MNARISSKEASASSPPGEVDSIRLAGVSKIYPGAASPALLPTDLVIRAGEFFSVLGPSGSGKTTTLRLIAGFERTDTGSVWLAGTDVTDLPPNKRDVNTVFQNYALFPHLSVAENVAYPLMMKKLDKASQRTRVAEALSLVEMEGFGDRLPHQMSGGQRQRIALARALVGRPKVLLLDEPLGALDLRLRQQMQHVLTSLQRRLGLTFIYVTHDQGEALSMSDRVAVVNKGRIEQVGAPEDLYYAPANEFVARFVGKSNLVPVEIVEHKGGLAASMAGQMCVLPQAHKPGRAKLVLRCENIAVPATGEGAPGSLDFSAQVRDVLFLGTTLEVALDLNGSELIALAQAHRQLGIRSGQAVQCRINPADFGILYD
jgi:spermidine/putrescine transport system ATP-binding protein